MAENVHEVPDDAMEVQHGNDTDHENHVRFATVDVIEWYTVYESGEIQRERFVDPDPEHPDDVADLLG